jgi:hypothetical protein
MPVKPLPSPPTHLSPTSLSRCTCATRFEPSPTGYHTRLARSVHEWAAWEGDDVPWVCWRHTRPADSRA